MADGRLITIEGIDGAGKTTLAAAVAAELESLGIPAQRLREPGGVRAAERIREIVKDPDLEIGARAEALLYAAARAQLAEEALLPLLAGGTWVVLDRFVDSSLAYQGGGRRLGVDEVRAVNDFGVGGLQPDRTLLLMIEPALGRARASSRGQPADRLEREEDEFFTRITATYRELAEREPERVRMIDAGLPPDRVLAAALEELSDLI